MELLQPEHPPHHDPTPNPLTGLSSPADFTSSPDTTLSEAGEKVYVAVGTSVEKALSLLQWSFNRFSGREICLLHVHRPSNVIPTLLGKLPVSQASEEVVSAFRREEKEKAKKLLDYYLSTCVRTEVKPSILVTEADQVHKGILELVTRHCIKKLVIGAIPKNRMMMRRRSTKATYASKNAPGFCEIWFVNKGKRVWVREAVGNQSSVSSIDRAGNVNPEISRSRSFHDGKSILSNQIDNLHSMSARTIVCDRVTNLAEDEQVIVQVPVSPNSPCSTSKCLSLYGRSYSSLTDNSSDSAERRLSCDTDSKVDGDCLYSQLKEARIAAKVSRKEALSELLKFKKVEAEVIEAINKVKAFEFALAREAKLREETEDALRTTLHEQEKLLDEREKLTRKLHKTMRNVARLEIHARVANHRHGEVAEEFRLTETSIAALRLEKQRIRQQKMEAVRWLDRWRSYGQSGTINVNEFVGFSEDLPELAEFSLTELQTATCNFSESFKLGQGGNGCVYKGEMMGRTVAIKKLHPYNMQGQSEFQQEVRVLSKLQHPHLVTLFGYCPEAWTLVYEYLPNGSLQDRLFRKSNVSPLPWQARARIIGEISSALCFLHSSKPEKIVHGDLKPENILLGSELSCKICDFGICRLVTEEALYSPNFHRNTEPKGAFPYTDPEFHRFGVLTPKSDVYSFGVIILQLLTGRPPIGLVGEVRKAASSGKLASILDSSAGEWPIFVARRLADIGLQCCESYSRVRPNLTPSLIRELEQLHVSEERPVPSFFLCPILQEIMHDPQIAADGFTYEEEAIREWFSDGHETSPMTNLKLSHLHLTPNHALRLAIQDWLCKS